MRLLLLIRPITLLIMLMGSVFIFTSINAQDLPSDPDDMFDIEIIDDSLDLMLDDSLDLMLNDSLDLMLDDSLDLMLDDSLDLDDTTWLADEYEEIKPWTLSSGIFCCFNGGLSRF